MGSRKAVKKAEVLTIISDFDSLENRIAKRLLPQSKDAKFEFSN